MISNRAQKRPLGWGALGKQRHLFYFITLFKNIMSLVTDSSSKRQTLM